MTAIPVPAITTLRNVSQQYGFTRKLFGSGSNGISGAQAVMEFRQLAKLAGLDLPASVNIGLDSVQIILAGGQVVSDFQTGADMLQCVGDISMGVAGVAELLADCGLGEPFSQIADFASLGTNAALAVSSCGANVLADIGVVISLINVVGDVSRDFMGSHDAAVAQAKIGLKQEVESYLSPQIKFAAAQAQAYKNGQLDFFDFVGNVALQAPAEFKQFFPGLACYFPSWATKTFSVTGSSGGLFGSSTDTESYSLRELATSRPEIQQVLWQVFLNQPMQAFEQFFEVSEGISLQALSILSMLTATGSSGAVVLGPSFDILSVCQTLGVTPGVLGDDWLFKGFMRAELDLDPFVYTLPYQPLTLPLFSKAPGSGLVINGVPQVTRFEARQNAKASALIAFQQYLYKLDQGGDIATLMTIPEAKARLKAWASWNAPIFGQQLASVVPIGATLDISDYWKCLSTAKAMAQSGILGSRPDLTSKFGTLDGLMGKLKQVYQFVMGKQLNLVARGRIGQALGIPASQLASRDVTNKDTGLRQRVFFAQTKPVDYQAPLAQYLAA